MERVVFSASDSSSSLPSESSFSSLFSSSFEVSWGKCPEQEHLCKLEDNSRFVVVVNHYWKERPPYPSASLSPSVDSSASSCAICTSHFSELNSKFSHTIYLTIACFRYLCIPFNQCKNICVIISAYLTLWYHTVHSLGSGSLVNSCYDMTVH